MQSDTDMKNPSENQNHPITKIEGLPEPIEVKLPNNSSLYIRPEVLDRTGNASMLDLNFSQVIQSLEGLSMSLREGFSKAKPSKTSVELSLDFAISSGKLTTLLVEGDSYDNR